MNEYRSEAIVLDAEPVGEADTRFSLFTERFGRIVARGKSARKITSKLTPHLQVGDLSSVRIVEKNGLRIADALKARRLLHAPSDLRALGRLLHDAERDSGLWQALTRDAFSWRAVLALLGWDPEHALCVKCRNAVVAFLVKTQEFVCEAHVPAIAFLPAVALAKEGAKAGASKLPPGEVVSI